MTAGVAKKESEHAPKELKKDEMNDSGHSSVTDQNEMSQEEPKPMEKLVKVNIQPSVGEPFEIQLSENDAAQELYQTLLDRESTCHRTCFSLTLDGQLVDMYMELRSIPGFQEGCTFIVIDEPYTMREVRLHIRQLRELLKFGLNASAHELPFGTEPTQLFLPTVNMQGEENPKASGKKFDVLPPEFATPGSKDRSLMHVLVTEDKPIVAVKNIAISSYNPPTGVRKMKGDVMYVDVNTVEDRTVYITCCTKGFYVNKSQENKFDPTPMNSNKTVYSSLVELLNAVSPGFKKTYPLVMKRRSEKTMIERLPTMYPTSNWLASPQTSFTEDYFRSIDLTESHRFGLEDHLPGSNRDWNEELQTTFELPRSTVTERIVRDRSVYKAHSDFVNAAAKGVQAIIDGNIVAINNGDEKKTHMYIWNNIFFSLGFDVKDHYKDLGGDAAAFAAGTVDLQGVKAYWNLEDPKLHTLGMAIFDYRGYRITAQSIIPGILDKEQDQSVIYGSIDFGKTIKSDESYHELLENVANQLHMLPHKVIPTKDGEDQEEVVLYTSYETKGIVGNDGRKYVLDLLRTMPPDVNFLLDAEVSEEAKKLGYPRKLPHTLASLRKELVDSFYESKCVEFFQVAIQHVRESLKKANESNDEASKKIAAEAEAELTKDLGDIMDGNSLKSENKILKEAFAKACNAVNSLSDDRLVIKFNPDCFSSFVKHSPSEDLPSQRRLVVQAASFILTTMIPQFVQSLTEYSVVLIDGDQLSTAMHQKGINMRYLGEIAKRLEGFKTYANALVVCEIVARCVKHVFRNINYQIQQNEISECYSHLLNCLFGNVNAEASPLVNGTKKNGKKGNKKKSSSTWASMSTTAIWKMVVEEASVYYGFSITEDSLDKLFEKLDIQKTALLCRVCRIVGVQIVARDYQLDMNKKIVFTCDDILNIFPIVKHNNPYSMDAKKMLERGQHAIQFGSPREGYEFMFESANLMSSVFGAMHPDLVQAMHGLAKLSYLLNDTGDALSHQHKATMMSERVNGMDSGKTIMEYMNLAHYAFSSILIPGALRLLYRARYLLNVVFGEKHPLMAQIDANIGIIMYTIQEFDTALKFLISADQISKDIGDRKRVKNALISNLIARTHAARGDFRAALVAEKETFNTYMELYGAEHQKTVESGEYLKTLTQQAVSFQKRLMESNKNTSISELFQIQSPTLNSIIYIMNIINGMVYSTYPTLSALAALEKMKLDSEQNGSEEKKETVEKQLQNEALD